MKVSRQVQDEARILLVVIAVCACFGGIVVGVYLLPEWTLGVLLIGGLIGLIYAAFFAEVRE